MRKLLREIRIVQGNEGVKESLQSALRQVAPDAEVIIPKI
ncbi:MAG: hypothetical protein ACJA0N_000078 [Pseudohongiellaceae bacterium]|jgi:hypothetical protein